MGMIEYKSKAGEITPIEIDEDFPKCVCGGKFKVQNIYTKSKKLWGTSADCEGCKEHFFQGNYGELKKAIPHGQHFRKIKDNTNKL